MPPKRRQKRRTPNTTGTRNLAGWGVNENERPKNLSNRTSEEHQFLQLNTTMMNCSISQSTKVISWDLDNVYFDSQGEVAVHSMTLFSEKSVSDYYITVQSNIIEEDPWNSDGIICCMICSTGSSYAQFTAKSMQFYKIDCARPRHLAFKLNGIHLKDIKFAQIVLAIR